MKFRKKTLISAGVATVLVLSAAVILFLRESVISPEKVLKVIADRTDLEVRNVLYRELGGDGSRWEIRAEKASYTKKEDAALFDRVEVKLFLSGGKTLVMTGDKGRLDTSTKDIRIDGNVGIASGGGENFKTDYLQYSYADKRLHTKAPVLLETPQMRIKGVGMSLSLKDRKVVLLSRVQARIK